MEKRRLWLAERKERLKEKVDQYRNRPKKNPPLPQNAIGKLNDRFRGLKYKLIKQDGPLHSAMFAISLDIQNQFFVGLGNSKKRAKLAAAQKALKVLGITSVESAEDEAAAVTDVNTDDVMEAAEPEGKPEPAPKPEPVVSSMEHAPALPIPQSGFKFQSDKTGDGQQQQSGDDQQPFQFSARGSGRGGRPRGRPGRARGMGPGGRGRGGPGSRGGPGGRGRGRGSPRGGRGRGGFGTSPAQPANYGDLNMNFRSGGMEGGNMEFSNAEGWSFGDSSDDYMKPEGEYDNPYNTDASGQHQGDTGYNYNQGAGGYDQGPSDGNYNTSGFGTEKW